MCHLNNLKVAKKPLPLPGELKHIWLDTVKVNDLKLHTTDCYCYLMKVIDDLHLSNHKDKRCHEDYSMEKIKRDNPNFNTMACEQTFAWLSRHKKILCAMTKCHFHFYLHRMIKRRNTYITYCYSVGKRVVSPAKL